jgi:hypothetical protein
LESSGRLFGCRVDNTTSITDGSSAGAIRPFEIRAASFERNSHGRIKGSPAARADFRRQSPCPSTGRTSGGCPGYVIDHQVPLKRGGTDSSANMQWQTREQARAKDRVE